VFQVWVSVKTVFVVMSLRGTDTYVLETTIDQELEHLLYNLNTLAVISNGTWAVKQNSPVLNLGCRLMPVLANAD